MCMFLGLAEFIFLSKRAPNTRATYRYFRRPYNKRTFDQKKTLTTMERLMLQTIASITEIDPYLNGETAICDIVPLNIFTNFLRKL